jgi:hypothetical protein
LKPPIAAGSGESGSRHHSEGEVKARLTIGGSHRFDRFCQPDPEVFLQQTGRIMSGETLYIPAATQQSAAFPRESVRAAADDHRIVPYDAGSRFAYRDDSDLGPNAVAARRNAVSADGIRQRIAGCASAREQRLMKCECREGGPVRRNDFGNLYAPGLGRTA